MEDLKRGTKSLVRRSISIHYTWIVWYACLLHFAWATMLLFRPYAGGATPVHTLYRFCGGQRTTVAVLAGVATMALTAPYLPVPRWGRAVALIPQQFILLVAAGGGIVAVAAGHYADGVPRAWDFILADQLPVILAAALHTVAVIEAAWTR